MSHLPEVIISSPATLSAPDELAAAARVVLRHQQESNGGFYQCSFAESEAAIDRLEKALKAYAMQPDGNGWIKWGGGPCPVEFETIVDISRACGIIEKQVVAGHYSWGHHAISADRDITAFRIHADNALSAPKQEGASDE